MVDLPTGKIIMVSIQNQNSYKWFGGTLQGPDSGREVYLRVWLDYKKTFALVSCLMLCAKLVCQSI